MNVKFFPTPCVMDDEVKIFLAGQAPLPAQTMDISHAGMRVRFAEKLEPGTPIRIHWDFIQPDQPDDSLEVDAEVLNRFPEPDRDTWQIGVRLKFADVQQEEHLLTYLHSCEGVL